MTLACMTLTRPKWNRLTFLIVIFCSALLSSCGGGGGLSSVASSISGGGGNGGSGGGIGGSGVTSSGPVAGFGSVFVNGVEFETDDAEITVNGERVSEAALGLGMLVVVQGTVNADGVSGIANTVAFESALRGPVASIARRPNGDLQLLEILGIEVLAQRGVTVFDAVDFETLAVNDLLDVSGYVSGNGRLVATRIARTGTFVPAQSAIDRVGVVSNVTGSEFTLGDFTVEFSTADVSNLPESTVREGARVLVRGTLIGSVITARQILEPAEVSDNLDRDTEVVIQGAVTNFAGLGQFNVGRLQVDATDAVLDLAGETLNNRLIVQVSGTWNGQRLIAQSVVSRQGRILVGGIVASVSADEGTMGIELYNTVLDVLTNTETLVVDNTRQQDRLTLAGISVGDYVLVEALSRSNTRLALRISRSAERSTVLNAPVEAITAGDSISLQGIAVSTLGAEFFGLNGSAITSDAFYLNLAVGDLVRVTDEVTADGRVDSVRLIASDLAPQLLSR
ncbi:MAG: DUF5666 domain-containing protein [Halioglobus sp.]